MQARLPDSTQPHPCQIITPQSAHSPCPSPSLLSHAGESAEERISEPRCSSRMQVSPIQLNPSMPGSSTIHTFTTVRLPIPAFARMRERAQLLSTGPEARYTHRVFVCLPPLLSFQVANSGPVCKAKLLARRERGGDGWWMFARAATWRRLHSCAPPSQHIGLLKLPLQSFVNCSLTSKRADAADSLPCCLSLFSE